MPKTIVCNHTCPAAPGLRGIKLAFVSDIHVASYRKPASLGPLFALLESLGADLLLWGGDFAESPEYERAFFRMAARLQPCLGSFAVMGNNDREAFGNSFPLMRSLATRAGIRLLINEEAVVDTGSGRIRIAGLDEWKYGLPNAKGMFRAAGPEDLRVLLTHYPHAADTFAAQAALPAQLCLAGHTHGGQIRLFGRSCYDLGYGYKYARNSERFFVSGWRERTEATREGDVCTMRMLVSNGVGESLMPLRLFCPRQVHLIELI